MSFSDMSDAMANGKSMREIYDFALSSGNINSLFKFGDIPERIALIHWSVLNESAQFIKYTFDCGGNLDMKTSKGDTPLTMAIILKNFEIVKTLVEIGADINTPGGEGDTPLIMAILSKQMQIAQYLLDCGANPDIRGQSGLTARMMMSVL